MLDLAFDQCLHILADGEVAAFNAVNLIHSAFDLAYSLIDIVEIAR